MVCRMEFESVRREYVYKGYSCSDIGQRHVGGREVTGPMDVF